jgi:hypothetical protein
VVVVLLWMTDDVEFWENGEILVRCDIFRYAVRGCCNRGGFQINVGVLMRGVGFRYINIK